MGKEVHAGGYEACTLFTNESRATLDGLGSWGKGWVFRGVKNRVMFRL